MKIKTPNLHRINNYLSVLLVVLALYILVMPFLPLLQFYLKKAGDKSDGYVYSSQLKPKAPEAQPTPQDNRLVIPSLVIDESIKEGKSLAVINHGGTWRRPASSTPDKDSNTVIIGHRFTYDGNSTFYNLDKLKIRDDIIIYWQGREYDYKVSEIKTVPATANEIEAPSTDKRLTSYTCTPLWSAKDRLVIVAKPIGTEL